MTYQFRLPNRFPTAGEGAIYPQDLWRGVVEDTTAHGIPHLHQARGPLKNCFWGFMLVMTIGGLIGNITLITMTFFNYDVDVSITIEHENELTFPAVTVCNMSPVKKSALESNTDIIDTASTKKRRRKRATEEPCPLNWLLYNISCYKEISGLLKEWDFAEQKCAADASYMTTIHSLGENEFVGNATVTLESEMFWLGLRNTTGTWVWTDGTSLTFTNWATGEPNSTLECVVMDLNMTWKTEDCDARLRYSCETPIVESTVVTTSTAPPPSECCCPCCGDVGTNNTEGFCAASPYVNPYTALVEELLVNDSLTQPVMEEPQPIPGSKYPERVLPRESFQEEEKLTETLAELSPVDKASLGYQAGEFVLDCQYEGSDCSVSEFDTFYNPVHGNCFIFNSGWNASKKLYHSSKAGRRYGLHLIVNLDQDEYVEETGDTAGLRLVITTQNEMPFPEDEGVIINPGEVTALGINQITVRKQGWPYGDCIDPKQKNNTRSVYQSLYPVFYSKIACIKTCYQRHLVKRCSCADPYYPSVPFTGEINAPTCRTSNIEEDDCRYEVSTEFQENRLDCDCPDSCGDTSYNLHTSTGMWPSEVQKDTVLRRLAPSILPLLSDPLRPNKFMDNLVKVEIYYEDLNIEQIEELPAYPPGNYLSDIGGVLGLWLGMSILTIFEFVEFFMDIIVLGFQAMCCNPKKKRRGGEQLAPLQAYPAAQDPRVIEYMGTPSTQKRNVVTPSVINPQVDDFGYPVSSQLGSQSQNPPSNYEEPTKLYPPYPEVSAATPAPDSQGRKRKSKRGKKSQTPTPVDIQDVYQPSPPPAYSEHDLMFV